MVLFFFMVLVAIQLPHAVGSGSGLPGRSRYTGPRLDRRLLSTNVSIHELARPTAAGRGGTHRDTFGTVRVPPGRVVHADSEVCIRAQDTIGLAESTFRLRLAPIRCLTGQVGLAEGNSYDRTTRQVYLLYDVKNASWKVYN